MQTVIPAWNSKGNEGIKHRLLKSACLSYLETDTSEKQFEDGIADVLYGDTIIECLSNPTKADIALKLDQYKSRNLIIAVPSDTDPKLFEEFNAVVWFVNLTNGLVTEKRFKPSPASLLRMLFELSNRQGDEAVSGLSYIQPQPQKIVAKRRIYKVGRASKSKVLALPPTLKTGDTATMAIGRLLIMDPFGKTPEEELLELLEKVVEPAYWERVKKKDKDETEKATAKE